MDQMNKKEFTEQLRYRLNGLPAQEIEDRLAFYTEMIDDRTEDGMTEEEAVSSIGTVDSVVEHIMREIPLNMLVKNKVKRDKKMPVWAIVLLVIGFPVWFPICISLLITVLSIYLTIWIILASLFIVDLSFGISALAGIVAMVTAFIQGNIAYGIFSFGAVLILGALAVLLFFGCIYAAKGCVWLTGKMLFGIKSLFIGKEGA